jgi:hypothetical protein
MCPPIIGIVLGVVASLASAAMASSMAKQQAKIEQYQLQTEMENERIKAIGDTTDRLRELARAEATNRAALAPSGVENISYEQGIVPYNQRIASTDVARTEFNAGQVIGRKKYEISVAGWRAKSESRAAWIGAGAKILGDVGGYVSAGAGKTSGGSLSYSKPV